MALFPSGIVYIEGGRTASGFFTVEEAEVAHRMFRLHELPVKQRQLYLQTVTLSVESLDSHFVYLIDGGYKIFIWYGTRAKNTMKQKARLLAEKMNKEERKNKSELIFCTQGDEPDEFWDEMRMPGVVDVTEIVDHLNPEHFKPMQPVLYKVGLGMGYLELPQVEYKKLTSSLLETKNVYVLDCHADLFIW